MKITKRGVNSKRHTTHYLCGGKWRTRKETVSLAEVGKIPGVFVCKGKNGKYIQAHRYSSPKLYELEEVIR